MPTESLETLQARLSSQEAAPSHLERLAALHQLCKASTHCLGLALVGSFAQGKGDRISDLDLVAFVADDREAEFMAQVDLMLGAKELVHAYGQTWPGRVAFRKYVYLDFSSCEFHAFNQAAPFRLRRPYLSVWDPHEFLKTLEVDEAPPQHESFEPYPHGDDALIWELFDCIKWLKRGRQTLAKTYIVKLANALRAKGQV